MEECKNKSLSTGNGREDVLFSVGFQGTFQGSRGCSSAAENNYMWFHTATHFLLPTPEDQWVQQ